MAPASPLGPRRPTRKFLENMGTHSRIALYAGGQPRARPQSRGLLGSGKLHVIQHRGPLPSAGFCNPALEIAFPALGSTFAYFAVIFRRPVNLSVLFRGREAVPAPGSCSSAFPAPGRRRNPIPCHNPGSRVASKSMKILIKPYVFCLSMHSRPRSLLPEHN